MGIKYKVNEDFFRSWNPEMAYVLGYLYADGSLEDASYLRGKYIKVTSTDKSTIIRIKKLLESEHSILVMEPNWPNGKLRYLLRIGSHKLYDALMGLGLYPNKSLTVQFPKVSRKHLRHFVRGYFDGDGCIFLERSKGKTKRLIVKRLRIIFTSGSKRFLETLNRVLQDAIGVNNGRVFQSHRSFQLNYPTFETIDLFKFLYHDRTDLYLRRKFSIFKKYFSLRSEKIDRRIAYILGSHK